MKKLKVNQAQAIFYRLYEARKQDKVKYIPIFELMGEVYVKPLGIWGFVSYEGSARMSEMFSRNPKLFERTRITGKSGSKYYGYRLALGVTPECIIDPDLKEFYYKVYSYYKSQAN